MSRGLYACDFGGHLPVRASTVFNRLLRLPAVSVSGAEWTATTVRVTARLRRLRCPVHGVVAEGVPFARPRAHLTTDLDDLLAWLATRMDKTAVARLCQEVRRDLWQTLRRLPAERWARDCKGARWALLKNPDDLTATQAAQLAKITRGRGGIWRAYEMKEQFRAVFAGDIPPGEAIELLDRGIARTLRSRLAPSVKTARTMRDRRGIIVNAIEAGISNRRVEGLNTKVRLLVRRAYGFHSAEAALAMIMLACGPIDLKLPHEHSPHQLAA